MKPSKKVSQGTADTLTVSQAAKASGKSVSTIRRWIDEGFLKATKTTEGWRLISHNELMVALSKLTHETPSGERHAKPTPTISTLGGSSTVAVLEQALKREREAVEREQRLNDELRSQIRELDRERTQHLAEMRALLSKDAKATDGVISRWLRR